MVTIEELETAAALGWRAPEEERLGAWWLRAAAGFTGRANSALAVGDPGRPLPATVAAVRDWYAARGLPATIAVPYPLGGADRGPVDRQLDTDGWTVRPGAGVVMTGAAAAVATAPAPVVPVRLDVDPDEEWLALYHYRGRAAPPVAGRLLRSAPWQAFASVRTEHGVVAIGRVAVAAGWAGLTAVEVRADHRRQGLATTVTTRLAAAAVDRGVQRLYLQVEDRNDAARALYRRVGFTDHHGYHYRIEPQP